MSHNADYERMYREAEAEGDVMRAALNSIAQYDPRWTFTHVNDAPSRSQLIARAYDALIEAAYNDSSD